ncbi:MAG TPA: hypothetical protein VKQ28_14600 [Candidatus Acidoferrum sp.]|nr:hypothetical protein [Candidatus Acidoferrum sp.]
MRTFDVTIEGTKPILLHNPAAMKAQSAAGKKTIPTPEKEALDACYWTPDGDSLAFPSYAVHSALVNVSFSFKKGKINPRPFVAGSLEIVPDMIPFGTKEYEIDVRQVVVQRARILRSRAKLFPWRLSFVLLVDEDFPFSDVRGSLLPMLEEAGRRIGLGDFRPQRLGPFGKFIVKVFEERTRV